MAAKSAPPSVTPAPPKSLRVVRNAAMILALRAHSLRHLAIPDIVPEAQDERNAVIFVMMVLAAMMSVRQDPKIRIVYQIKNINL